MKFTTLEAYNFPRDIGTFRTVIIILFEGKKATILELQTHHGGKSPQKI